MPATPAAAMMNSAQGRPACLPERVRHGRVLTQLGVRDHAGEDGYHGDIKHRANEQGRDYPDGDVAFGVDSLLGMGGDGVEADISEEDYRRAGYHSHRIAAGVSSPEHRYPEKAQPRPAERRERHVIGGMDEEYADKNDEKHRRHFQEDHGGVEPGAFPYAFYQDNGDEQHRADGRQINPGIGRQEMSVVVREMSLLQVFRQGQSEFAQHALEIARPAVGHRGRSHRVFKNQVPAYDPGEDLSHGGIGVGVGGTGHRGHCIF